MARSGGTTPLFPQVVTPQDLGPLTHEPLTGNSPLLRINSHQSTLSRSPSPQRPDRSLTWLRARLNLPHPGPIPLPRPPDRGENRAVLTLLRGVELGRVRLVNDRSFPWSPPNQSDTPWLGFFLVGGHAPLARRLVTVLHLTPRNQHQRNFFEILCHPEIVFYGRVSSVGSPAD